MFYYHTSKITVLITWVCQIVAILIMAQTLYYKFTAAEESVYIFSKLGMEPLGRIGIGMAELLASVMLLIPLLAWVGAMLAIGIMAGAIFFHLTILGLEIMSDGGYLFILALTVFLCSCVVVFMRRGEIPIVKQILN